MVKRGIKYVAILALVVGVFVSGLYAEKYAREKMFYELPKEFYECFIAFIPKDPMEDKICVVYRAKGLDLSGAPNSRHRNNNIEQRQPVRSSQSALRDLMENAFR